MFFSLKNEKRFKKKKHKEREMYYKNGQFVRGKNY